MIHESQKSELGFENLFFAGARIGAKDYDYRGRNEMRDTVLDIWSDGNVVGLNVDFPALRIQDRHVILNARILKHSDSDHP